MGDLNYWISLYWYRYIGVSLKKNFKYNTTTCQYGIKFIDEISSYITTLIPRICALNNFNSTYVTPLLIIKSVNQIVRNFKINNTW